MGYVEEGKVPFDTALKEIREETGFVEFDWRVFPFLFKVEKIDKLKIDWEHSDYCWIFPSEINEFDTVPRLREIVSEMFK